MSTYTIANRTAAGGRVGAQWDRISRAVTEAYGLGDVAFTDHVGHGIALAGQAIEAGATRVVVVGGDGTINEVLNGYMRADAGRRGVELAIYPLGTGGDLARSLGLKGADRDGFLRDATARTIDVGCVRATGEQGEQLRYFLNIASAGATGEIVDRVNRGSKRFGAKAAFVWGTLKGLSAYRNQRIRIRVDDSAEEELLMSLAAVGNGRFFGGGMKIAPDAALDDGLFDICVVGDIGVADFVRHGSKLYRGEHGGVPEVRFFRGRAVHLTGLGDSPVLVEADGEVAGRLPASFAIHPDAATVLAPWGSAEAISRR
ncbi:MAG: diacylglycerol kinase family protein [Myxococcota bacterium]